jgi:dipeptidyl aminopeptidase/acylaminoacyl peptidase
MQKQQSERKINRVSQYFAIRQILSLSVSPDGNTVAYITNTNGLPNIWTIPIKGGWTSQITLEENAVKGLSYSPRKDEILFTSDMNGDENDQLFLISDKGGETLHLTPEHKGFQVFFVDWDKKGETLLFTSNKRDKRFFDTYIHDLKSGREEMIHESNDIFAEFPSGWSRDKNIIVFTQFFNNSNQDIILFERKTGKKQNITEHKGSVKNYAPYLDKKTKTLYFLSDYEREFTALAYYSIKTGKTGWFITEKWDITLYKFSKSEKYLLYSVNNNGISVLKLHNTKTGRTKKLKLPKGNVLDFEFTPDDTKVVMICDAPDNPNDIFVYNIKNNKIKQITFSMIGGIPKDDFTKPSIVTYESYDGLRISANLYIPKWLKKNGSNPAVLWPHGGPEWQERPVFNKYFQILTNRGYIVIAPNFRGSTGYGKTFQSQIYKDWGGAEFKDILGAYNYLLQTGYTDKSKIAVVGGSFGGFMTLTCITKAPDLWKCAVDIFGPSNLCTFLNSVPEHWKPATWELVGHPEKDKELLYERSPFNFVENIRCPLLIVQGKNDPRVVQSESDQIVEKLKSQNKTVEYLILEDEGHGFTKVSNQIKVWNLICEFLDKHMK